ncbi:MAG TPA: Shedu immune nuclease family protein [Candidatus Dormibacteraeota bacterium]|nr:Shedu immune nuclease family protein [Candidatus Dormibacteraeota bacterium]
MNPKPPYERVEKDLATKTVYHYVDERNKLNIKSKEVFKKTNRVVFYPFGRNGKPKYEDVKRIVFVGMPDKLPRGFSSWSRGYGFTKTLSRLVKPLSKKNKDYEIIIGPKITNKISGGRVEINSKQLDLEFPKFSSLIESHNKELDAQAVDSLGRLYPGDFKPPVNRYKEDMLSRFVVRSGIKATDLSRKDVNALLELTRDTDQDELLSNEGAVLQARERIEKFYIENVIEEFEKISLQKNESQSLEERWQKFFKRYNWIFSQLFSSAVLFFEDKAYVGGKSIDNKDGKVADFVYKNSLTDNVAIIEIKTHNTPLLKKHAYRGEDVFAISKELSGAINQVLDQRDNLQKEYYELNKKADKEFETYNSKCLIVAGSVKGKNKQNKKAFELQRSNSKDVEVVTFDEILMKLKGLKKIITGRDK